MPMQEQQMTDLKSITDTSTGQCAAALNIAGKAYRCDLGEEHNGWIHSSVQAQAIWCGPGDES